MDIFLKGLFVGLAYVAPIGMQNIFVITAALKESRQITIKTALVVIFFDIALSFCCFFGIGKIIENFPILEIIMLALGGIVVAFIGFQIFKSENFNIETDTSIVDSSNIILKAFAVTFLNPQALIDGTMLFGGNISALALPQRKFFIMGSASSSFLWFFSIAMILPFFKNKTSPNFLNLINKACGIFLIYNGISLFYDFIQLI